MSGELKKLIARKMAVDAIPPKSGLVDGVNFLRDKGRVMRSAREAKAWAEQAVSVVRDAADPNPWRDASDDEIAAEILRRIRTKATTEKSTDG